MRIIVDGVDTIQCSNAFTFCALQMKDIQMRGFSSVIYKDLVDDIAIEVAEKMFDQLEFRVGIKQIKEEFFPKIFSIIQSQKLDHSNILASELLYLCINVFLFPRDISIQECAQILTKYQHIKEALKTQPRSFRYDYHINKPDTIPEDHGGSKIYSKEQILSAIDVISNYELSQKLLAVKQNAIPLLKQSVNCLTHIARKMRGSETLNYNELYAMLHNLHSELIIQSYIYLDHCNAVNANLPMENASDSMERFSDRLQGGSRMHASLPDDTRSIDAIATDVLLKLVGVKDSVTKQELRSVFLKEMINHMQSKGDKRNIDIQKAADTVMIIFLDALLFPVDIPSITIYKYAKISHPAVVFGYHADIPELIYLETVPNLKERQYDAFKEAVLCKDLKQSLLYRLIPNESDVQKLQQALYNIVLQLEYKMPFAVQTKSVAEVVKLSWCQVFFQVIHQKRQISAIKQLFAQKTMKQAKLPQYSNTNLQDLQISNSDLISIEHNQQVIFDRRKRATTRKSDSIEHFASSQFDAPSLPPNKQQLLLDQLLFRFIERSVLDPKLLALGQFIGHQNQVIETIKNKQTVPVVPIIASSMLPEMIGELNIQGNIICQLPPEASQFEVVSDIHQIADRYCKTQYDSAYQLGLQISTRQLGKAISKFKEQQLIISMNSNDLYYKKIDSSQKPAKIQTDVDEDLYNHMQYINDLLIKTRSNDQQAVGLIQHGCYRFHKDDFLSRPRIECVSDQHVELIANAIIAQCMKGSQQGLNTIYFVLPEYETLKGATGFMQILNTIVQSSDVAQQEVEKFVLQQPLSEKRRAEVTKLLYDIKKETNLIQCVKSYIVLFYSIIVQLAERVLNPENRSTLVERTEEVMLQEAELIRNRMYRQHLHILNLQRSAPLFQIILELVKQMTRQISNWSMQSCFDFVISFTAEQFILNNIATGDLLTGKEHINKIAKSEVYLIITQPEHVHVIEDINKTVKYIGNQEIDKEHMPDSAKLSIEQGAQYLKSIQSESQHDIIKKIALLLFLPYSKVNLNEDMAVDYYTGYLERQFYDIQHTVQYQLLKFFEESNKLEPNGESYKTIYLQCIVNCSQYIFRDYLSIQTLKNSSNIAPFSINDLILNHDVISKQFNYQYSKYMMDRLFKYALELNEDVEVVDYLANLMTSIEDYNERVQKFELQKAKFELPNIYGYCIRNLLNLIETIQY